MPMAKTYHMRRADKLIEDKAKLVKILKETSFMTVAMANVNEPYIVALSTAITRRRGASTSTVLTRVRNLITCGLTPWSGG
jgi:nitroimidazol reductase NimA-like FMN-containing flavoprotein (pyridoxamine 5'-phosphate oxidase superfamily)